VFPSTAICGVKLLEVELLAVTGWFSARFVVDVTPVPDSATVSGLPGALLATDSEPVSGPPLVGENLTLTVQDEPAAIEPPQLLVWLNGPVMPIEETDAALLPGLVTVTGWAALVDPEFTSPNDRLVGDAVSEPGCTGSGNAVSTGVVLQPELPLPRLNV
jgi:hypothetical protein